MKVLVTGGLGFIGSAVVRHLLAATDAQVVNLDAVTYAANPANVAMVADDPRYQFVRADIRDGAALAQIFEAHRPDAVLHLAAESHVDRSIDGPADFVDTNVSGTYRLLEAVTAYWKGLGSADQDAFRFVHVSTDEVYGALEPDDPPFNPATAYDPRSPYSATKAASDHLARAWFHTYGLPVIVSNCSNNYGPYQFPEKLIPLMILRARDGKPLPVYGEGENIRDWLHVEDHARGLWAMVETGAPGATYLLGGDAEVRNFDVVKRLCAILDARFPDVRHEDLITFVTDRPGHDFRYAIDFSKTTEALGWQPSVTFEEGLEATVDWYLANEDWWRAILDGRYNTDRLGLSGNE